MSKFVGKKQILLAVLVLALGLAVYLNYYFANTPKTSATKGDVSSNENWGSAQYVNANPENTDSYFTQARENRSDAHKEALGLVTDVMNNVKSSESVKKEAVAKAAEIAQQMEQESKIENLIKAKGFAECLVYIHEDSCNIVVKSDTLDAQHTVQISEIVTSQSNVPAKNIKISNVK